MLFGFITTESAIENFDNHKTYITDLTYIYESYLDTWNSKVENPQKKTELDEALVQSYQSIDKIKDCIKKMNENNDSQYAVDAANIYQTILYPLLGKIRQLKYKETDVLNDDNYCKLIQRQYIVDDILISGFTDKLVSYDVGLKAKKVQQKKYVIADEDTEEEVVGQKELSIKIREPMPNGTIAEDEPIIGQGKDGIAWNNPNYQKLWDKLPEQLKREFKLNIEWMKAFMNKCVNKTDKEQCKLIIPPNIVIPPRNMDNGQYDFGVPVYNKVFNKLAPTTQKTYLSLYKEDPATKVKDYRMLEDAMNSLVEQDVNFKSFF